MSRANASGSVSGLEFWQAINAKERKAKNIIAANILTICMILTSGGRAFPRNPLQAAVLSMRSCGSLGSLQRAEKHRGENDRSARDILDVWIHT
jgi:hypothetical protein